MGLAQYQGNIHNKSSVLQTESSSQCSKLTERPRNNMNTYKEAKDERKERRIEKDKDTLRTDTEIQTQKTSSRELQHGNTD